MEKKQLISVVKPLIAAALLFGSSGGVAWGQTQMDCKNAFGAGESRSDGSVPSGTPAVPNRGGAGKITLETDSWLVSDPNNAPNSSIIIGTTSPNVVGEKWIFSGTLPPSQPGHSGGGWIDAYSSTYHIGVNATSCYDHRHCSLHDWRTASGSGTSQSENPVYTGCDNTFFRNHGGSYYQPNANWAGADFTSDLETVVNIGSGALGGSSTVGTTSTNAFDCDYFYFKNIPYQIKKIEITGSTQTVSDGCASCQYTTYSKNVSYPGGNVDQGRIVLDAGSHIHLRKDISADGGSGSKAVLDLPSGGTQYSLMVDGDINQAAVISRGGGGVINNLASMAPKAVIGVYGDYLPGSSGAMGTDANGGGGTILIGPSTGGQNKMTIVASTQSSSNTYPHGFF